MFFCLFFFLFPRQPKPNQVQGLVLITLIGLLLLHIQAENIGIIVVMSIKPATGAGIQDLTQVMLIIIVIAIGKDTHVLASQHRLYRHRLLKAKHLLRDILMEM